MARLIDADKRIAEIKKLYCDGCDNYGGAKCRACWVDDAMCLIDDAPTVDAVENERTVTGMVEYIEREAAIESIMSEPPDAHYPQWYADKIKAIPATDVAPVRHGRWELTGADKRGRGGNWKCTGRYGCGKSYPYKCNFCPNCGAKMECCNDG